MNLSKSRYGKCIQCEKMLWWEKHHPEYAKDDENKPPVFETGRKVGELAKGLLGDYKDIPHDENLSVMIERTKKLMQDKPNIITEASFSYDNNFCSVDILKNDLNGVEIYEVKSSTEVKDIHKDDVAYQYFVLSNLGLNVKKVCIVHLNSKTYTRRKELDINQLFDIKDVTVDALERQDLVRNNIDRFNNVMEVYGSDEEPEKELGSYCLDKKKYGECSFWQYCSRDLPKPNVFDISNMSNNQKFEKYHEGKISFEDLENDESITNTNFIQQIDFELHDR